MPSQVKRVSYTYVCTHIFYFHLHPKDDSTCDHCDIQDSQWLKKASCAARMADGSSGGQDVAAATEHRKVGRNKMEYAQSQHEDLENIVSV